MKTETLFARVTPEMARKVQDEAARTGESDAYVLREALREYFARREAGAPAIINEPISSPMTPAEKEVVAIVEAHYGKKPKKKRARSGPNSK